MRKTYASEAPLPADVAATQRLIGARTREERLAVEAVLREFFTLREDGWHNTRCDAEIARYQDKQRKAKASAEASWAARRAMPSHSERNANASETHMRTESERNANAMRTQSDGNAPRARSSPQSPVTSLQTPEKEERETAQSAKRGSRLPPDWSPAPDGLAFSAGLINGRTESELAKFRDYWAAQPGQKGVKTDWPATWRNWVRRVAESPGNPGKRAMAIDPLEGVQ